MSTVDRQELDAENVPDAMEGEQTWPTVEEMREAEAAGRSAATPRIKKVPKGFSEYQAAWIVDEEGERLQVGLVSTDKLAQESGLQLFDDIDKSMGNKKLKDFAHHYSRF